eukprot:6480700-Amphidinium_carterae.2
MDMRAQCMLAKLSRRHHRMDVYTGLHEYFTYLRRFKSHFRVLLAVPDHPPLEQPHPQTAARMRTYTIDYEATPLPSWTKFAHIIVEADNFPEPGRTELKHFDEPFESVYWMAVEYNALAYDIILRQVAELATKIFSGQLQVGNSFRFAQRCLIETFVEHTPTARLASIAMPYTNNYSNEFTTIHHYIRSLKPHQKPSYTTQNVRYKPGVAEDQMHPAVFIPEHLVEVALSIIEESYQYALVEAPHMPAADTLPNQALPFHDVPQHHPQLRTISPTLPLQMQQQDGQSSPELSLSQLHSSSYESASYNVNPPTISSLEASCTLPQLLTGAGDGSGSTSCSPGLEGFSHVWQFPKESEAHQPIQVQALHQAKGPGKFRLRPDYNGVILHMAPSATIWHVRNVLRRQYRCTIQRVHVSLTTSRVPLADTIPVAGPLLNLAIQVHRGPFPFGPQLPVLKRPAAATPALETAPAVKQLAESRQPQQRHLPRADRAPSSITLRRSPFSALRNHLAISQQPSRSRAELPRCLTL